MTDTIDRLKTARPPYRRTAFTIAVGERGSQPVDLVINDVFKMSRSLAAARGLTVGKHKRGGPVLAEPLRAP